MNDDFSLSIRFLFGRKKRKYTQNTSQRTKTLTEHSFSVLNIQQSLMKLDQFQSNNKSCPIVVKKQPMFPICDSHLKAMRKWQSLDPESKKANDIDFIDDNNTLVSIKPVPYSVRRFIHFFYHCYRSFH